MSICLHNSPANNLEVSFHQNNMSLLSVIQFSDAGFPSIMAGVKVQKAMHETESDVFLPLLILPFLAVYFN